MLLYVLFIIALLLQVTAGRTQLLTIRGNIPDRSGLIASLLGIASGLSFFVLIIWAFATFDWYVVLPAILVTGLSSGFIVGRKSFYFWYQIRAIVDLFAAGLTIFLWLTEWPFSAFGAQ